MRLSKTVAAPAHGLAKHDQLARVLIDCTLALAAVDGTVKSELNTVQRE